MYNMMLGPLGDQFWAGPDVLPRARFHMDRSRVGFPAGLQVDPLYAFSYGIGDQQPAAITNVILATQADILDTSISRANALSKTCLATHLGITMDRAPLIEASADIAQTIANTRIGLPRLMIRVLWAERGNEEAIGKLEDFPEGIGIATEMSTAGAGLEGWYNGFPAMSSIKPLPRPLACKGGDTFFQVAFEPSVRDGGMTHTLVTSYTARVYGIAPARVLPSEAPRKALQALGILQAE